MRPRLDQAMPDIFHGKNLKGLPVNLPTDRKSYCLPLPDDVEYRALYIGALSRLANQSLYDRDPTHKAKDVAAIWYEIWRLHSAILFADEGCNEEPCVECCTSYIPEQDWVAFFPQDPFTTPDYVPAGYLLPPFYTNAALPFTSILPTDALLNILAFPLYQNLLELLQTGLPRCEIRFTGTGQIEVELIKLINGGWAWVQLDDRTDNDQVVNLNSIAVTEITDLQNFLDIAIEGSLSDTEIVEFDVDTVGDHKIVVYFLPDVGPDVLFGFGGGVRSIEMCGGLMPIEGYFAMQLQSVATTEGCYMIQWRPNSTAAWLDLQEICNGAAGADAPPVHFGFDSANCNLKYTQGDIYSPYTGEGSEWITVFDWNNTDLRECLGLVGDVTFPPVDGVDADMCNLAWAMSRYVIDDLRALMMYRLSLTGTWLAPGVASSLIMSGDYPQYDWLWFLTLTDVFSALGEPVAGDLTILDNYQTECLLAESIYNALSEVSGTITLNAIAWDNNVEILTFGSTPVTAMVKKWVDIMKQTTSASVVQQYLTRASVAGNTGEDCTFDCEDSGAIIEAGLRGVVEYLGFGHYRATSTHHATSDRRIYLVRIGGGCFQLSNLVSISGGAPSTSVTNTKCDGTPLSMVWTATDDEPMLQVVWRSSAAEFVVEFDAEPI